jgi:hypothetical protein
MVGDILSSPNAKKFLKQSVPEQRPVVKALHNTLLSFVKLVRESLPRD